MDEFITCKVCMEIYNGELKIPRMLVCGHTFCSSCITKLLEEGASCPNCKTLIDKIDLHSISINYAVKQIAEKFLSSSTNDTSSNVMKEGNDTDQQHLESSLSSRGPCKDHHIPNCFRCITCNEWVCGNCVAIDHKFCKTLYVTAAIEEMKQEQNNRVLKHIDLVPEGDGCSSFILDHYQVILDTKAEKLQSFHAQINQVKEEILEVNAKMKKVSSMQAELTSLQEKLEEQTKITNSATSPEALEAVERNLTKHFSALQDIVAQLKFHKSHILRESEDRKDDFKSDEKQDLKSAVASGRKVFVISKENEFINCGELEDHEGQMRIRGFKHNKPFASTALYLTVDECLTTVTGKNDWPRKIFLELATKGTSLGTVLICLKEPAKEATKLILHTFLFGLQGTPLISSNLYYCGIYSICSKDLLSVPPSIDGQKLLQEKEKKGVKNWKEGEVALQVWNGNDGMMFSFFVFTEQVNRNFELIPIGIVERGIEVPRDASQRMLRGEDVNIIDCGWVIN